MWRTISRIVWLGTLLGIAAAVALAMAMTARVTGARGAAWPYVALLSVVTIVASILIVSTAAIRGSNYPVASLWSFTEPRRLDDNANAGNNPSSSDPNPSQEVDASALDWGTLLAATGVETRFGDALQSIIDQERGTPLAGIILLTDGQNNSGIDPLTAAGMASSASIPIYSIGIGSPDEPVNVRVVDVEAPKRVYPDDRFRITALVQATGLEGKQCSVQLRRRAAGTSSESLAIEEEVVVALATPMPFHRFRSMSNRARWGLGSMM